MQQATSRVDSRQALAIRRWALGVLAGVAEGAGDTGVGRLTDRSAASWSLFLRAERCAAALDARLTREARAVLLPEIQRLITQAAEDDAKRALSARGQLRAIGRLAQQNGATVVVLKGGLPVARGANLHLVDIDVLVPPEQADALASALEAEGYWAAGWSSPRHLSARVASGTLPIEIHTTTDRKGAPLTEDVWREVRPIENEPGLCRLSPPEHLWHVLSHIVVDHPYRRGRIRDLIVLSDAVDFCSEREIQTVIDRSSASPHAATSAALIAAARALFSDPRAANGFEAIALQHYTATVLLNRLPVPSKLRETVWKWTFALLSGRAELREVWADTVAVSLTPSPYGVVSRVERRLPRLGRTWRLAMRLLRLTVALPIAVVIAIAIRHQLLYHDDADRFDHASGRRIEHR